MIYFQVFIGDALSSFYAGFTLDIMDFDSASFKTKDFDRKNRENFKRGENE
jgi:hypothetical protein